MGIGYYYSGETYYGLNDGEHFFENMNKALSYLNQAGEWELMVRCYNYMGIVALNRGNIPIALDYYLNGLNHCETYHFTDLSIIININLGVLYYECGRYADSQQVLETAYDLMMKTQVPEQYDTYMICLYGNLARALVQQGRWTACAKSLSASIRIIGTVRCRWISYLSVAWRYCITSAWAWSSNGMRRPR